MDTQEQKRMMVLNRLLVGQLTAVEAAVLLDLSERQVRRLFAGYQKEGAAALVHNGAVRVTWRCQFVTYHIPTIYHVTGVKIIGKNLLLDVWFVVRPIHIWVK